MPTPFIVYCLPRSRSSWMTYWLGEVSGTVGHDVAARCESIWQFGHQWDQGLVGTIETAAVLGWRVIREMRPELKIGVVRRPVSEVIASLAKFGIHNDQEILRRDSVLDEISRWPDVMSIGWKDLSDQTIAGRFWSHLRGDDFDPVRWDEFCQTNIQVNVLEMKRYVETHQMQLSKLKSSVAQANGILAEGGDLGQMLQ